MARPSVGRCAASPTRVSATSPPQVGHRGMADALLPAAVATATGVFCWLATRLLIPFLRRRDMLDYPNERSSHFTPTPRGGGIAVTGSVLLACISLHEADILSLHDALPI